MWRILSKCNTETIMTKHEEFWSKVSETAISRIYNLFSKNNIDIKSIIDKECIENYDDAKTVLSFVLCHADTDEEKACSMLSICEWLHACNELQVDKT